MKEARGVLIVDDEPDMCWALQNVLLTIGLSSRTTQTGASALEELQTASYGMVLLDAKLRDIDGFELAKQIKALAPKIRIIMISGYYYKHDLDIQRAIEEGILSAFVAKPFRHDDIIGIIERRKHRRYYAHIPLVVHDIQNPLEMGRVVDISEGGLRIMGIHATEGAKRAFMVQLASHGNVDPFFCEAECRWFSETLDIEPVSGFRFTNITESALGQVKKIIGMLTPRR
jgi:CheY-like chemotaxis protein